MTVNQVIKREWRTRSGNLAKLTKTYYPGCAITNIVINYFKKGSTKPFRVIFKQY